jgi:hypothetical protein
MDNFVQQLQEHRYEVTPFLYWKTNKLVIAVDTKNPVKFTIDMVRIFGDEIKGILNATKVEAFDDYFKVIFIGKEFKPEDWNVSGETDDLTLQA